MYIGVRDARSEEEGTRQCPVIKGLPAICNPNKRRAGRVSFSAIVFFAFSLCTHARRGEGRLSRGIRNGARLAISILRCAGASIHAIRKPQTRFEAFNGMRIIILRLIYSSRSGI